MKSIALIRGVGGATAMKMAPLRDALTQAGFTGVQSLQVAGNIVFDDDGEAATGGSVAARAAQAARIRATVAENFGHDLPVIIRSHEELQAAANRNPFLGTHEGKWVMTVFLEHPATKAEAGRVAKEAAALTSTDTCVIDGAEAFIRYDGGVATSKLQSMWLEKRLGIIGTARNANTIAKLLQMSA